MKVIKLKNGSEEALTLVTTISLSIRELLNNKPMALYDMVMKCRDDSYSIFGNNTNTLKNLALLGEDGKVHNSIKNIVLSSIEGEGLDMKFVYPIKGSISDAKEQ